MPAVGEGLLKRYLFEGLYRSGLARTMWDRDVPDEQLLRWAARPDKPGTRALDIGCGSGSNALHLAGLGYKVDAVDFSAAAIIRAKQRVQAANADITLLEANVLQYEAALPYQLVVDYGCFHSLDPSARPQYVARVAAACAPRGEFVLMAMAPRWPVDWRIMGPHHLPPETIAELFGRSFRQIEHAEVTHYWTHAPTVYRPLSGPYRAFAYRMARRGAGLGAV